ncbi:MAG: DNRLRE domain-containing protein, partial [Planctomycetota bacterium]
MRRRTAIPALAGVLVLASMGPARAEVTRFQNGVAPTKDYAGCVDTCLEGYRKTRPRHEGTIFWTPGRRRGLLKFDLAAVGKDRRVHRAVLRLFLAEIQARGTPVPAYTMAREWDETATWIEWKQLDGTKSEANNWTKPGGDIDRSTDWGLKGKNGKPQPGLVARAPVRSGPMGHYVEFDVTGLVSAWHRGEKPNCGFLIDKHRYSGARFCSSEWPVPAFRPTLIVQHTAPGKKPDPNAQLTLPPAPGPKASLSPLARTAPQKQPGQPARTVRLGRNSNCGYRKGHRAGYVKTHPRFRGNWDWTPRIRVGGTGGDFNRAWLRFDLSALPKNAYVAKATLRAFAEVGNQRPPDQETALGQVPKDEPKERKRRLQDSRKAASRLARYSFGLYLAGSVDEVDHSDWKWKDSALVAVAHLGKQWADDLKKGDSFPETWIEWDVTGVVQKWADGSLPNRGFLLDHRLMGGHMVIYSDEWIDADRRPYLELEVYGDLPKPDGPFRPEPLVLPGDDWIEPMRKVHARWDGTPGTFAQYGDSITVTMAFWTPLLYGEYEGGPKKMHAARALARKYIHKPCWRNWKGGKYGCGGGTTINWAFAHIDEWQKRMNPEAAVVMWGTNDAYLGPHVPEYTEKYAAVVDRMLRDGTVPIITTLPPRHTQRDSVARFLTVWNFRLATLYIARARKLPVIDLWAEMVRRRPDDWDGSLKKFDEGGWKGYNVPTMIARDGIHPSYPKKWQRDWSKEGLRSCGLGLRNYLTLRMWARIHEKVLSE